MNSFSFDLTPRFVEQSQKLSAEIRDKLNKCLRFLAANPKHPSLKTHKVEGAVGDKSASVFEAYVDMKYRLTWEYGGKGVIVLRNVDNHDACLANP